MNDPRQGAAITAERVDPAQREAARSKRFVTARELRDLGAEACALRGRPHHTHGIVELGAFELFESIPAPSIDDRHGPRLDDGRLVVIRRHDDLILGRFGTQEPNAAGFGRFVGITPAATVWITWCHLDDAEGAADFEARHASACETFDARWPIPGPGGRA